MDDIFEPRKKQIFRRFRFLLPAILPVMLCIFFLLAVSHTSEDAASKEQNTLTQALKNGAIYTYALTGSYPESLDQLLEEYHITYDSEKFLVEYVPNGSNLLPMISVLPATGRKGGLP